MALYTDGVQRGCSMYRQDLVPGFTFTGETIHSHPVRDTLALTDRDLAWNRAHGVPGTGRSFPVKPGFSRGDRAAGPGWLVQGFDLRHHDGKAFSLSGRWVARLAPREQVPPRLDRPAAPPPP